MVGDSPSWPGTCYITRTCTSLIAWQTPGDTKGLHVAADSADSPDSSSSLQ